MKVSSSVRKAGLTMHVLSSVGWAGAVAVYLALGIAALTSGDAGVVRAVYVAMDLAAWLVLVPLVFAALVTGVLQAMLSPWGLFRHYWVILKLGLTLVATVILVAYTETLTTFAEVARREPFAAADLHFLQDPSVVLHTSGGLALLLAALVLAIYKPTGLTRFGHRQRERARAG